ncbi:hypothetical protein [Maricaulis sp.]|uniref:hypothetical protein n=1 Tax=Maricaulis sp. TaxID=1486257 RepID=UPI0025BCBF61|nr:hypothetical protein [Maricaulis sp.]
MPSVAKQVWSDFISVVAVWAAAVFLLMFHHEKVGIHSEWMPQVVFGSFAAVVVLAPIGSLLWRRFIRPA